MIGCHVMTFFNTFIKIFDKRNELQKYIELFWSFKHKMHNWTHNRTQLFPEPLYQVVELQEMQKSISQRFTHLSAVRRKISALESHCLVPLQLFWDTTASLLCASEGRYLQLRKANTKSVSSLADFFVCKFGWRVCIACWNSPEVQL